MVIIKCGKACYDQEQNSDKDFISKLPEIAIDKILKRLPIKTVAKMSILSKKWRTIWLSLKYLHFDDNETTVNSFNCIVSNILFNHVGPVHEFYLESSCCYDYKPYVNGWVSLLSKVGIRKVSLIKDNEWATLPLSIFNCKDLIKLRIKGLIIDRTPSLLKGFAHLRSLELITVWLKHDVLETLIANCPRLIALDVADWYERIDNLVIDVQSLEYLTITGEFETIVFKNVQKLRSVSIDLTKLNNEIVRAKRVDHTIEMLASSCQLEVLHFGGEMCKYFGAGYVMMLPTLSFLQRLRLTDVDLSDYDEFCFTLCIVQCCPFIEDLDISSSFRARGLLGTETLRGVLQEQYLNYQRVRVYQENRDVEHEFDYNKNCELKHLVKLKITGLEGSSQELKLIEYLLSNASNLEKLVCCCYTSDPIRELKVARGLLELPRASSKAKLVLEKWTI